MELEEAFDRSEQIKTQIYKHHMPEQGKNMVGLRDPMDMINRRRRQIHVHSVIYYHHDMNLVPDHIYDSWCVELAALQKVTPESKHTGYKPSLFEDWTGETGFHLPAHEDVLGLAEWLVRRAAMLGHVSAPSQSSGPSDWKNDVSYRPS